MQTSPRLLSFFRVHARLRRAGAMSLVAIVAALSFGSGCAKLQHDNTSSYLMIVDLKGSGSGNVVFSDVVRCVTFTGAPATALCPADKAPSAAEDSGVVSFALGMKNAIGPEPSSANFITVTGYHVEFQQIAGTPLGVPPAFDGGLSITVNASGGGGSFTLVPVIHKQIGGFLEPLRFGGEVQAIATVTFFGRDQAGREIEPVVGTLSVSFANWEDQ